MKQLLTILNDIDNTIDWKNERALIDDRILDSFGVITLVSELEDAYDIEIDAAEMISENFNSLPAILDMVQRLTEE